LFTSLALLFAAGAEDTIIQPPRSGDKYPNTYAKDIDIDAPWFVIDEMTQFPVQFYIKDANVIDLEELEGLYIEVPRSRSGGDFSDTDTIFRKVYSPVIEDLSLSFWDTVVFIAVPEGYSAGQTIYMKATIDFEDGLPLDERFSKVLAVKVGGDGLPKFPDWYQGDCHFHTSITNNAYEFGGSFRMIAECSRAMGVDFVMLTDHASDSSNVFGFLADDLNLSDWLAIPDSIATYGRGYPVMIRGEEADIRSPGSSRNHLLIYGNHEFFPAKIDFSIAEKTHADARAFLLASPEAVSYPAHPYNPDYLWEDSVVDSGFEAGVFQGLQIWNERSVFDIDVDLDEYCDPFPFSSGTMLRGGLWDSDLLLGLTKWDSFLWQAIALADLEHPRKIFINGGSDAHGDFNYFTYYPFAGGIPVPDIYATDNAFAKVRTLAYCPLGLDEASILRALRNGNTVVTDGPIINLRSFSGCDLPESYKIIGQTDTVKFGGTDSLKIDYKASAEFGGTIKRLTLKKIHPLSPTPETVSLDSLLSGFDGSFSIPLDPPVDEGWCCYRLEAMTFLEGEQYIKPDSAYRCFTNPIWFYVLPDTYLTTGEIPTPERLFLNIFPNPFNSSCAIESNLDAKIEIFDAIGQKLAELTKNKHLWKPSNNYKSGVYFIRAQKGSRYIVRRAIYIK